MHLEVYLVDRCELRANIGQVHKALQEKGYNPVVQLVGYILTEDPTYITNHQGARKAIARIEQHELLTDIVECYFSEC